MKGNKRQVKSRIELSVLAPFSQNAFQELELRVGPAKLKPEDHRHAHRQKRHEYRSYQELLGDHLMVGGEDILRPESLFVMIVMIMVAMRMCMIAMFHRMLFS